MTFPNLTQFDKFTVDTETTGLNWRQDKIFGVSVSTPDNQDYYWDVRETPNVFLWLNDQLKEFKGTVINHNLKFDIHMLREAGVTMLNGDYPDFKWDCTMIRAALIDEHRYNYNLDDLAKDYLGQGKVDDIYEKLATMFGGKPTRSSQMQNLHKAPSEIVSPYAKRDTRAALELWEKQNEIIDEVNMYKICALEREVMYVIQDMERQGIRIDENNVERSSFELERIIDQKQIELNKLAGFKCNPNPSGDIHKLFAPKWIGDADTGYWVACDGTRLLKTPKGKAKLDADALREMKHPAAAKIVELRKLMRCNNTFLKGHIGSHLENGRVYPNINQCKSDSGGTVTGRLSYTQPALQQIPSRDKEITKIVRSLFLPEEGQSWYRADFSQSDMRAFVHYTQSPPLIAAYDKDKYADFYTIAAEITGIPRNPRFAGDANAKQISLGLIFGMGEGKLAKEMGMPVTEEQGYNGKTFFKPGPEVKAIFNKFHTKVPGFKEFSKKAQAVAKSRGYLKSLMDRHMHFPNGEFAYKAVAFLCQSATSEFNKVKLVDVHNLLKGTDSKILLSVHDEINITSNDPDLMKATEKEMEDFHSEKARLKLRVPMVAEMNSGQNWHEAK